MKDKANSKDQESIKDKQPAPPKHTLVDDIQGISIGVIFASFGIAVFSHMNFLIGGTAGAAFLTQYASSFSFGPIFFVINLPFYVLAIKKIGWEFTLKTFLAVLGVSFFSEFVPYIFEFGSIDPWFAAIFGGFLIGNGLLVLFRHNASLGGLNIMAIFLQENYSISAGKFQMVVDTFIILGALIIVDWKSIAFSVLAAIALNIVLAINHKPGRYPVMS